MAVDSDCCGEAAAERAADLFRANLTTIRHVITRVSRRAHLGEADADDFASVVNVALIEDSYAVLRAWRKRSSLATYLTVIVERLLSDERMRARGRWEPSAAARRAGAAGILLETIVCRDGRPVEQALPFVQAADRSLTRAHIDAILRGLPDRAPRPQRVPFDDAALDVACAADAADTAVLAEETDRLSAEASRIMRRALASLSRDDATIVRCHFGSGLSIADISRLLHVPQRPLYRRLAAIVVYLRRALLASGIDVGAAESLIGSSVQSLDFGLMGIGEGVSSTPQPIFTSLPAARPPWAPGPPAVPRSRT